MIQFAHIEYLALVLIIPFLFIFHAINRRIRRKRIEKFGDKTILDTLMPRASRSRGWIKLVILSISFKTNTVDF